MSRAVTSKSAKPTADRRKTILYVTLGVIIVAIVVGVGLASRVPKAASNATTTSTLKVGDTAPNFSVQTDAGPFDLANVSSPVLVEIFATWCPHCQRETTVLNDLAAKDQGKIAIVAVSGSPYGMDGSSPESQADVNTFGQQFNVRYPIAFDPDPNLGVAKQYIGTGFPTLVLINKDKKVVWMSSGETPEATIVNAISALK
jgi:thiol-disulfide isomerase/thioredoxin